MERLKGMSFEEIAIKGFKIGLIQTILLVFILLRFQHVPDALFPLFATVLLLLLPAPLLITLPFYLPFRLLKNPLKYIIPLFLTFTSYKGTFEFMDSHVIVVFYFIIISISLAGFILYKQYTGNVKSATVGFVSTTKPSNKKINFNDQDFQRMLNESIVGQQYAKQEIVRDILKCINKQQAIGKSLPILGTFFFVGPTGVGKTELSKAIGDYFKRWGYQFLRFDMGNFSDFHYAATFTGSAKGYLGYGEGGALTKPLSENPRAVILFDEMEKTHSSLYRVFMTLIDEGEIQDTSTGQRIRLDQAIIIFTSNLYQSTIGKVFEKEKDPLVREQVVRAILTGDMRPALKYVSQEDINRDRPIADSRVQTDKFPPEFIGRIDKIIPFTNLSFEDYRQVTIMLATKYKKRVDVDAITRKYISIAQQFGVRQFIKKVEEDILLS